MAENALGGGLVRLMEELGAAAEIKMGLALAGVGDAVVEQAKINASSGEHEYGTQTPASPGSGPAIISHELVDHIGRDDLVVSAGGSWHMRVGVDDEPHTDYGAGGPPRTNAMIANFLEVEGTYGYFYPFLGHAATFAAQIAAATVMREAFDRPRTV